jgi:hypothetical protein
MDYCFIDNYSYYITFDGGGAYNTLQVNDPIKITYDRGVNERFVRCKTGEWKIRRGNNQGAYDALLEAIKNPDGTAADVQVKIITEYPNYNTHAFRIVNEYEGHVNLTGMIVDEDLGIIKFTPDTIDDYKFWDDHKDDKVNVKDTAEWAVEFVQNATQINLFYDWFLPAGEWPSGFSLCALNVPAAWSSSQPYTVTAYDNGWCAFGGTYYRCIQPNTNVQPDIHPAFWHEVTPFQIIPLTQFQVDSIAVGYSPGNGVYDPGFPNTFPPTPAPPGEATNCPMGKYYKTTCASGVLTTTVTSHGRKLLDVIEKVVQAWSPSLTITSNFFNNATNPITGIANRVNNIIFGWNKYIKAWPFEYEEVDVQEEVSLKDISEMLRILFNCYWYVDDGQFIIEHLKYFENDYSYTPWSPSDTLDLTDATDFPTKDQVLTDINGDSNFNRYSFVQVDIPKTESLVLSMGGRQYDGFIRYASPLAKKTELKHDLANFVVDLDWSYDFNEEFPDEGWTLMACDSFNHVLWRDASMGVPRDTFDEMVILTNQLNGDLWWSNIMADFHRYGRIFQNGSLNNDDYTFISTKEYQKQVDIRFPRYFYFFAGYRATSNLGQGLIQTMEVNTKTNYVSLTLYFPAPTPL